MKLKLFFLLHFLLFNFSISQQFNVKIIIQTKNILKNDSLYITGNHEKFGDWNPGLIKLEKISETLWQKDFIFDKNVRLEYKITLGSWNKEALDENGNIPPNSILIVQNDTTININIEKWKDELEFQSTITGTIHTYSNWEYSDLLPRDVLVWLPDIYFSDTTKYFPVIYAHDAQNLFDSKTAFSGVEWRADEITDSLINENIIEPIIVVGLTSTLKRREEYSYLPEGKKYMKFIINKVKPFIDNNYRTLSDRENTASLGASMGGLISFILAWEYNDVFSKAACFSPAFKIRDLDYVKVLANNNNDKKDISVYIDNGGIGLEAELQPGIDDMLNLLKNRSYDFEKEITWFINENAEHNEAAWSKRLWRPLLKFFGKK